MSEAKRDGNHIPTLLAVSSSDGTTPVVLYADPTTHRLYVDLPTGAGDVSKVGTPVDNQVGVWTGDGTIEGTTGLTYDGSNLQFTGDIGSTGTRITKGWFTDLQATNAIAGDITGNAATVTTITGLAPDTATTQATQANITTCANLVTVGALNSGSITSGFGSIDNGDSAITTTGVVSTGNIELGHATDTTLARVSAGLVSIEGVNIMTVGSADTVTGLKTLGTTGAIKLGSAVTDKCEIALNDAALNDETWSGTVLEATAGATLTVGDVCYLASSGKWVLNDGILDGTDTGFSKKLGICVLASTDTNPTKILLDGLIASAAFPAFTVGSPVYLDDTAGDLVVAQPSTTNFAIRIVGYAVSATVLHFSPSNDYIVHI